MNSNPNRTKEELLSEIDALKKENNLLRNQLDTAFSTNDGQSVPFSEQAYMKKIVLALPDMLTVLSRTGKFVHLVSSEHTNHVGKPSAQLVGRSIAEFLPAPAYQNVIENLGKVFATRRGSVGHHSLPQDDGPHHYENRIFPLNDEYALCMCRDVTDAAMAQNSLKLANWKMEMAEKIASLSYWYYYPGTKQIEAPGILPGLLHSNDPHVRCPIETYMEYVHPNDRDKVRKQFESPESTDGYSEYRLIIADQTHHLHTRVIHSYEKNGEPVTEGYIQDITYVAERLSELENVKYAVNHYMEEIYSCRPDGSLLFANQKFIDHYKPSGPLSGNMIYDLLPFVDGQRKWLSKTEEIRSHGGVLQFTVRDTSGRKTQTFDIVSYITRNNTDEEAFWFFARDVSVRVQQENRIRQLNYMMDAVLNNIPVYLFVKDPGNEFRYLYWNKAFEEYSGIPASLVLGKTDHEVFPNPKDAEKFRKDDLELLKNGERIEFIEQYTAVGGEIRVVKTSKALIPTEEKNPLIIGVSWDITDLKNSEKEMIAAKVKAEESDRLKSAFLANMSHEIRTPLNAIVGFSKLIAMEEDPEEKRQYSDIIDRNAELLLQLINDILDLSKIEAGTLEFTDRPMDLVELCRNMYEIHKDKTRQGVRLIYQETIPELKIVGDQNRLSQVITNLITNAIKFTGRGEIRFGFALNGNRIEFFVSDTGAGIPKDKLRDIFNRFTKLNNFAQGSGLGLAISKMIVEKLKGDICAESEENIGSTFRFSIPYISAGKPFEPKAPCGPAASDSGEKPDRHTVLIAEDNDSNYLLLQALIGKQYRTLRAHDGAEAVEKFKEHAPDLILMDIKMPGMNGLDATRVIRNLSTEIPIIAVTAFAFESDRQQALLVGCNDFLTKPVSVTDLKQMMCKYLCKPR